jgi:hypothetical protein
MRPLLVRVTCPLPGLLEQRLGQRPRAEAERTRRFPFQRFVDLEEVLDLVAQLRRDLLCLVQLTVDAV